MLSEEVQDSSEICPACDEDNSRRLPRYGKVYGRYVCRKCYFGFANRRQFAYLIDVILLVILRSLVDWTRGIGFWEIEPFNLQSALISLAMTLLLLIKDGFNGHSPGKALLGVLVLDDRTGEPAGFWASFKRNLPLLIPLVWIVVAFQLVKGHRWGDKWSHTKVVWKKYKDKPPFAG
ncbi:MAG: RDD family protein [Candidatus Coatesbacteria bacterium]|nr:RDD family protein [Candidatus Coatesbacteria bacterium]